VPFLIGPFYYYSLALLLAAAFVMWHIVRSPFGLCLRSIRENPDKAQYVGVSVRRFRFLAFLIAGAFGAVGGTLLTIPTGLADPLLAYWTHSGNLVFMMLLGGFTSFWGPLLGAFVFIVLQDQVMSLTEYWRFVFGGILAVIVIFFPHGLMGLWEHRGGARR
jgi:branched-chain amino acid transport system permease protein